MPVLIISDYDDYTKINHFHFSITKGFELAKGWSSHDEVYFLTTGKTEIINKVNLINVDEINLTFLQSLDIILFIRETIIHEILDKWDLLKDYIDNQERKTKLGIKSDSCSWVLNKEFRKWTFKIYKIKSVKWVYNTFDIIYCQTEEFINMAKTLVFKGDPNNKLRISSMAVPEKIPDKELFENPFLNHDNCVSNAIQMNFGRALLPNYFCDDQQKSDIELEKTRNILIFTGRLKVDGGKIILMLRDIMQKLGDDYELHIFPCSFIIPGNSCPRFSSKNANNLQLLRDSVFSNSTNVFIHYPYQHSERFKYLYYADLGIDFSQSRPCNRKSPEGNAKLLEYCSTGLPTVTEKNVNNSYLIDEGNNGILLEGIASIDDYVKAIKELLATNIDRDYAKKVTLERQNWKVRSFDIIKDFEII